MLVHSKLDYCNSLLANCPKYQIARLQKVQNAAVRFIFNARKRAPTTELLKQAHFLPVAYRIRYKLCMLAHKSLVGKVPNYIQEEFPRFNPKRSLRVGRDVSSICTKGLLKNTLSLKVAEEWNRLPSEMRCTFETDNFSKMLKTRLFKEAFNC